MITQQTLSDIWHAEEKAISILNAALMLLGETITVVNDVNIEYLVESAVEILEANDALFDDATLATDEELAELQAEVAQ